MSNAFLSRCNGRVRPDFASRDEDDSHTSVLRSLLVRFQPVDRSSLWRASWLLPSHLVSATTHPSSNSSLFGLSSSKYQCMVMDMTFLCYYNSAPYVEVCPASILHCIDGSSIFLRQCRTQVVAKDVPLSTSFHHY